MSVGHIPRGNLHVHSPIGALIEFLPFYGEYLYIDLRFLVHDPSKAYERIRKGPVTDKRDQHDS